MTRASHNIDNQEGFESNQEAKNDFWYSIALLIGNIGIIVKVLAELMSDRKK
ncbi:hypothetical protein ACFLZA_01925 [Candidatus Neomarinimicrobiota bacterium]